MEKKSKRILTLAYIISLIPMLLPQYGGCKGVQEISGYINLLNPIGILSVLLFFIGVWASDKEKRTMKIVGLLGCLGIVVSEIYEFLTWHIMTVTGEFSIRESFNFAFPEFYVGLIVSIIMTLVYVYFAFIKKKN